MASAPENELDTFRRLRLQNQALQNENESLKKASSGGTSGGMDGRIAKLEAHVETLRGDMAVVKKDVSDIRINLATLTERVAHLPGKGFIVTATTTAIGMLTAFILFGDKIRALLAIS